MAETVTKTTKNHDGYDTKHLSADFTDIGIDPSFS